MPSFCDTRYTSYSTDHISDNDHIIVDSRQPNRNWSRRSIFIYAICIIFIIILTIITTSLIIIFKRKPINSTSLNDQNLLLNENKIILNISNFVKQNNSFSCQLPKNPDYNKNGIVAAGVFATSTDELNKLHGPTSVYLDHERNIYVADTMNHRIRKYSPGNSDEGLTLIDETSNVNYPHCLFIDHESNHLYFLDQNSQGYYRVQLLKLNSNLLKSTILVVGNQTRSYGMTLDQYLNIYVTEYNHHRIIKWLSPDYEQYVIVVENNSNELSYPRSIYFDQIANNLYIANKNRIHRWSVNLNKSEIVMQGGSFYPNGIEYDCHGNLYISQDTTIKLISNRTSIHGLDIIGYSHPGDASIYSKSTSTADFYNPEGIYLDKTNGDLYVADSGLNRIHKYAIKN
ncbi:unnamed protein product [Adineta steineri]|uniref:Uncharacterized protein n=1 Tax=Adineta steineri TaxID=433720 RepID=A0A814LEP6_9BILA|nr:unnamed protein product [Adineta steineri]CAF1169340.1 unnamed protein product [Adineta steineri]